MVIQYGFVTLFVAAFPLAPLFALLNNIFEIRLDAYKFIVTTRRPIPQQAKNIGVWMTILDLLSNVAVLCNAFVIAFTSDLIPKLYHYSTQYTMSGYVNDSLSYYDARGIVIRQSDFEDANVTVCRYRDYRQPPCSLGLRDSAGHCDDDYALQYRWWIILSFRLIFVLLFELVVLSVKATFAYLIPDVPSQIVVQLQRERYLARQAILLRSDTAMHVRAAAEEEAPETEQSQTPASQTDGSTTAKSPARSAPSIRMNDNAEVAYQPGQESAGALAATSKTLRQRELENFRKLYADRPPPSLSPHPSTVDLTAAGSKSASASAAATPTSPGNRWNFVRLLPPVALSALRKSSVSKTVPPSGATRRLDGGGASDPRPPASAPPVATATVSVQQPPGDMEMRQVASAPRVVIGELEEREDGSTGSARSAQSSSFHTAEGTPKLG